MRTKRRKNPSAVLLGRRGGRARLTTMTRDQRREIARQAALARWGRTADQPGIAATGGPGEAAVPLTTRAQRGALDQLLALIRSGRLKLSNDDVRAAVLELRDALERAMTQSASHPS